MRKCRFYGGTSADRIGIPQGVLGLSLSEVDSAGFSNADFSARTRKYALRTRASKRLSVSRETTSRMSEHKLNINPLVSTTGTAPRNEGPLICRQKVTLARLQIDLTPPPPPATPPPMSCGVQPFGDGRGAVSFLI